MSIMNLLKKCKRSFDQSADVLIIAIIILTALGSFGLGRLSLFEETRELVVIEKYANTTDVVNESSSNLNTQLGNVFSPGGYYIASKNGSRFYFPWCGGADRIKPENKITFSTEEEAREAGYTPALNCKGL